MRIKHLFSPFFGTATDSLDGLHTKSKFLTLAGTVDSILQNLQPVN